MQAERTDITERVVFFSWKRNKNAQNTSTNEIC